MITVCHRAMATCPVFPGSANSLHCQMLGVVGSGKLNGSAPDVELSYRLFDQADAGKGITTEAVDLLAAWLFEIGFMNRTLLYIHVDNVGSHRVAEKCGFTKESTARESWYHKGKWHDLDIYTLTRAESDKQQGDR